MKKLMKNFLDLVDLGRIIAKVTGLELAVNPSISFETLNTYTYGTRWLVVFVNPQIIEFRIIKGHLDDSDDYRTMAEKVAKKLKVRTLVTFGDEYRRKGVIYSFEEVNK